MHGNSDIVQSQDCSNDAVSQLIKSHNRLVCSEYASVICYSVNHIKLLFTSIAECSRLRQEVVNQVVKLSCIICGW